MSVADPYKELPLQNDKYASLCTELHMANRNIADLANFDAFSQLSTLWINNNRLTKLEGLDKNVRIRNLHAHCNRISKLEGSSVTFFKFLENLTLNDNLLESIPDVVGELRHLRHLKSLDLFGNPISQEDSYRLQIISEIPWLKVFDRVVVTQAEINEAAHWKSRLEKVMVLKATSETSCNEVSDRTCGERLPEINSMRPYIMKALSSKRVLLEERFLHDDPRKTGIVSLTDFQATLKQYGILNIISEEEMAALALRYKSMLDVSGTSSTDEYSRELINYRKFCNDFLPRELRLANHSLQKNDTWKMEMVPEVSVTANDLRRYVDRNKLKREAKLQKAKREALFAGTSMNSNSNFSFRDTPDTSGHNNNMTDAWTSYMLSVFILEEANRESSKADCCKSIGVALANDIEFSKLNVKFLFERMNNHAKVPVLPVEKCLEMIFQSSEVVPLTLLWDFLGPDYSKTEKIVWRDMTDKEKENKEVLVFEEASTLFDSLLRSSSGIDAEDQLKYSNLRTSTIQSAMAGTRMAAAKRVR